MSPDKVSYDEGIDPRGQDTQQLDPELVQVARNQSLSTHGGKEARCNGTPHSANAVDSNDIQRIIVAKGEFEPHSVKANDSGGQTDDEGPARHHISCGGRDRGKTRYRAGR